MTTRILDPRSLLRYPGVFILFQTMIGARSLQRRIIETYIRPQADDDILDLGCGPGTVLEDLTLGNYTGVDIDPACIEAARKRYGDRARFITADVLTYEGAPDERYDIILGIGLLHHVDDATADRVLRYAESVLKPKGRLITVDPCYTDDQSRAARYLISKDRGRFVRTRSTYTALAQPVFSSVTSHVRSDILRLPWTYIVLECGVVPSRK